MLSADAFYHRADGTPYGSTCRACRRRQTADGRERDRHEVETLRETVTVLAGAVVALLTQRGIADPNILVKTLLATGREGSTDAGG
jgi:hypothetical protein